MRRRFAILLSLPLVWGGCSGSSASVDSDQPQRHANAVGKGTGASCTEAIEADREDLKRVAPKDGDATLDAAAASIKSVLSRGSYLDACEVSAKSTVALCVAVRDGSVLGATAKVDPGSEREANCVVDSIRRLSFAARPELVVVRLGLAQSPH